MGDQFGIEVARSTASELKEQYGGFIVTDLNDYQRTIAKNYFFIEISLSGSYTRASRARAREIVQLTEQGKWDPGQLLAVPDPYPPNPSTTTYYHATPAKNIDEIEEDGLFPSPAEECEACGVDKGIYITKTPRRAERWARLMQEEGWQDRELVRRWILLALDTPDSLPIVRDVAGMKETPLSYIICTKFGLPPRFIRVLKAIEVPL